MAKITAPILSLGASGTIADTITFSKWKGRPYARQRVIPANPKSTAQTATRSVFTFSSDVWRYWPAGAKEAWELYAQNSRITPRNGFMGQNISALRSQTDLLQMVISTSAGSGLVAAGLSLAAGANQITATLTAPELPSGWTIVEANALAIANVNPSTETTSDIVFGTDATDPYEITLTGLTTAQEYLVGGWFKFQKSASEYAYGLSLTDTATPS